MINLYCCSFIDLPVIIDYCSLILQFDIWCFSSILSHVQFMVQSDLGSASVALLSAHL